MDITKKKAILLDLDNTLIKPKSGNKFPQGVWDMELKLEVFEQLKKLHPLAILIASNQGGIELGIVHEQLFIPKFIYVIASLQEYVGYNTLVAGNFCSSNDPTNEFRKPNFGMYDALIKQFEEQTRVDIKNCDILAIGDASGLPGNFSDNDLKTAQNFGCDYMDIKDFLSLELSEPVWKVINLSTGEVATEGEALLENLLEADATKACERLNFEKPVATYVPQLWVTPKPAEVSEQKPQGKTINMKPYKK